MGEGIGGRISHKTGILWMDMRLLLVIPPLRSTEKQRRNGTNVAVSMSIDVEISVEPMPYDCKRIALLRLWATHHKGEVT